MAEKVEHPSTWVRTLDNETESPVDGVIIGEFIYLTIFSQSAIPSLSCSRFSGKIPEWLEGSLIRNGSGILEIGETKMNHLFDGLSVLNRFAIDGHGEGKATFQNRILRSETYKDSKNANRLSVHQFGKMKTCTLNCTTNKTNT